MSEDFIQRQSDYYVYIGGKQQQIVREGLRELSLKQYPIIEVQSLFYSLFVNLYYSFCIFYATKHFILRIDTGVKLLVVIDLSQLIKPP